MGKRYMSIRVGRDSYYGLIAEETKRGLKILDRRVVPVNRENISENGFDRDALKSLFQDVLAQDYTIIMPYQDVLTGITEFPLSDRKKIENALRFELENEIMDSPDNLLYDYRVINNVENRTQVVYFAVRKDSVRSILSEFSMIGIDPAYLVSLQNLYSGFYKTVFSKDSPRGVKLFLNYSDNILGLSFVDSEGLSFGRVLQIQDFESEIEIVKNFIIATIQYYKIRAKKDIAETYIISEEDFAERLYTILINDIRLSSVSRLTIKDADSTEIESLFVLSYAVLNGRVELTKRQLINFRKDEFIYKGEYEFIKRQLMKYGIVAVIIILLAVSLTIYKFRMLSQYDNKLNNSLAEITKQILGKPYDNFTTALAVIKSKTEPKNLSIPTNSAFDYFMFFSDSFPQEVDVNIRALEIGDKKIRMEGETDSFESVDRVVNALKKNNCFKDITKGKVKKSPDGKKIDFDLSITPSC